MLGNHIIDDLVIDLIAKKENVTWKQLYEDEKLFERFWGKILNDKQNITKEILELMTNIFLEIVNREGYLCLSNYRSYMERLLDLKDVIVILTNEIKVLNKKD